ncbi:MAG TPA: (2Fe-2S) ferredoxin domain-containing protein [Kofleriaceae bacterium]|nr:(2Fe-2S) ferredoxin domain-containing protein [Kofleriaceae bacterium]
MAARRFRILVCRGPECGDRRGSAAIHAAFAAEIQAQGVSDRCELAIQSCFGRCTQGPNTLVRELPAGPAAPPRFALADLPPRHGGGQRLATALYSRLDPGKVAAIVAHHVVGGRVLTAYVEQPEPVAPAPVPPDRSGEHR